MVFLFETEAKLIKYCWHTLMRAHTRSRTLALRDEVWGGVVNVILSGSHSACGVVNLHEEYK